MAEKFTSLKCPLPGRNRQMFVMGLIKAGGSHVCVNVEVTDTHLRLPDVQFFEQVIAPALWNLLRPVKP